MIKIGRKRKKNEMWRDLIQQKKSIFQSIWLSYTLIYQI